LLKKISDTLGVLGLGELRSDIDGEIDRLKSVVERGGATNESVVLDIASTLLRVEDRLDQQLIRLTVPRDAPVPAETEMSPQDAADYRQVAESVMRECIINLARIKETIGQSLASRAPSQGLDSIPSLVRGIRAGLLMLNKTRAMDVMERIGKLIMLTLQGGGPSRLTQKETDRRRCHREHRVLHGNGEGRPCRPVVHAGQRGSLPGGAARRRRAPRAGSCPRDGADDARAAAGGHSGTCCRTGG
jgi:chemosensory pili system protein ChpA (sensor histidine kinase/response regulator)